MSPNRLAWCVLCMIGCAVALGCAKGGTGIVPATPTPSTSPTAVPSGSCNTTESTNPNLVLVGIGSELATAVSPSYGQIAGYALFDGTDIPDQAQVISTTLSGAPITSADTLQFTNIELVSGAVYHSAVGFPNQNFPAIPYAFPSPAASPSNSVIGSGFWSTGRIPPAQNGQLCFSQVFTLDPGTYYFGDLDYYNTITSYRDVLVVQP